ncbi:MAG TPA: hypothetical protein VNL77_00915 [Roseiflexaceae bacterium]|nr:hypothetical protein [Roseiflexaceae bacterium]
MTQEQASGEPAAIERLVMHVRGVQAVRVVRDGDGQIDELHVVGTPERSAKAIVRDIESILYVRGGVRLNHRKISLVQVPEHPGLAAGSRVQLVQVGREQEAGAPVTVTLSTGERQVRGVAQAAGEGETAESLVGRATIDALGQLVGMRGTFQIERVQRQPFGELDVCLAHVSLLVEEALETLLGISVVRGDTGVAAARAVLDAVNRRLPSLLRGTVQAER